MLRLEKNLNQGEFASTINLSQTTLSNYEHGRREIRTETLLKIAEFFDVNVEYLIERTDYRQSVRSFSDIFLSIGTGYITNGKFYEKLNRLSSKDRITINSLVDMMLGK